MTKLWLITLALAAAGILLAWLASLSPPGEDL